MRLTILASVTMALFGTIAARAADVAPPPAAAEPPIPPLFAPFPADYSVTEFVHEIVEESILDRHSPPKTEDAALPVEKEASHARSTR